MKKENEPRPAWHAIRTFLLVLAAFLLYAFAAEATQIDLEEPLKPRRQEQAVRVLRAIAQPDIFVYDEEIRAMDIAILMPCPESVKGSRFTFEGRVVELIPNCVNTTQDTLQISGTGFRPRTSGIIRWHPPGEVVTTRALSSFRTDSEGNFEATFEMPDIRETDTPQRIEIEEKWATGILDVSEAVKITWEKIIETVLLAFMATTVGTLLAIPISFLAARNLMVSVSSPLTAIMAAIVALPFGVLVGSRLTALILSLAAPASEQTLIGLVALPVALGLGWAVLRLGPAVLTSEPRSTSAQITATVRLIVSVLLFAYALGVSANLGVVFGSWLEDLLDFDLISLGFIGGFIFLVSDFIRVTSAAIIGLFFGLVAASTASRYGQEAVLRLEAAPARLLNMAVTGLGSTFLVYAIGSALDWLYQFDDPAIWTTYPALGIGVLALIGSSFLDPRRPIAIGFITYTTVRGVLNIIRSIEPLVYVIVFAVWVGIGPFAGVLALSLHTIAALGKLFSEQVENIAEGPIEAITATGANRLQTIVFAVIPQIVPPYIAFTFYRWDINVRVSTIIGFGGGGGIGFVLAQSINLLQYRQASVMMIAIAIVVMTLDYVSSKVRERII